MLIFLKIFQEGIILALQELWANKLRTFLSLLGISIGIFCVISVLSVIDSFQAGLKQSFNKVGNNTIHVSKESWDLQKIGSDWWKYMKRPYPNYREFKALQDRVQTADKISIRAFMAGQKLQYRGATIENGIVVGATYDFGDLFDINVEHGRYFTTDEMQMGRNAIVIGATVAENLFPSASFAIGQEIKHHGRKLTVIGVIKKEGESLLGDGFDDATIVPYEHFRKYYNVNSKRMGHIISMRASEGISLDDLKEESRGILRGMRHLKPREEDNFELNNLSLLTGLIDSVFSVVSLAGFLIGFFAILVGGFGIANIMFVSVKERTRIIGIKKSMGAKRIYILLEFLTESIILTIIGGLLGLGIVYFLLFLGNQFIDSFTLFMSTQNAIVGVIISVVIGIVAGFIPAFAASRMDPVEAIRS